MKLYVYCQEQRTTWCASYLLVTEDGEVLAQVHAPGLSYARCDLILNRPDRHEKYTKRFGHYKVIHIGEDEMTEELMSGLIAKWEERNAQKNDDIEREEEK